MKTTSTVIAVIIIVVLVNGAWADQRQQQQQPKGSDEYFCDEAVKFNKNFPRLLPTLPLNSAGHDVTLQSTLHPRCMYLNAGWWEYELCWDRWLRQYHAEKGVILAEYFLGLGNNWDMDDGIGRALRTYADGKFSTVDKIREKGLSLEHPVTPFGCRRHLTQQLEGVHRVLKQKQRAKGLSPFLGELEKLRELDGIAIPKGVAATFPAGTKCDLTGRPRRAEIVPVCDVTSELGGVGLYHPMRVGFNVSENQPCEYVVFVTGSAVCEAMEMVTSREEQEKNLGKKESVEQIEAQARKRREEREQARAQRPDSAQGKGTQQPPQHQTTSQHQQRQSDGQQGRTEGTSSSASSSSSSAAADSQSATQGHARIKPSHYSASGSPQPQDPPSSTRKPEDPQSPTTEGSSSISTTDKEEKTSDAQPGSTLPPPPEEQYDDPPDFTTLIFSL